MDELLDQFRLEAPELVQQAADDLLALERGIGGGERLAGAFRAVHTLKGSVALFDMAALGEALHAGEDRLGEVRAGRERLEAATLDPLLELLGAMDGWFASLGPDGALPPGAADACRRLARRLRREDAEAAEPRPEPLEDGAAGEPPAWAARLMAGQAGVLDGGGARTLVRYAPDADAFYRGEDPLAAIGRLPGLLALDMAPAEPWPAAQAYDPFRCALVLSAVAAAPAEAVRAALRLAGGQVQVWEPRAAAPAVAPEPPQEPSPGLSPEPGGEAAARRLRVEPARVDALMGTAEELVAAVASLSQVRVEGEAGRELAAATQSLQRLSAELHAAVVRVRLAPLSRTFERLPRLVRELSARLGKPARLETEGGELEADRTVVDGLYEPLLHLIRNALDHGAEDAAGRSAAGKPATAVIRLQARAVAGELRLELSDDGRGIDQEALRRSAVARGLIPPDAPDDGRALELLFLPGFSTAAAVSDVSGRGVGLDSVRRTLEALGGRVSLASEPGLGAQAHLSLPVAAVLSRLLLLEVGGETYGAPLGAVMETLRLPAARVTTVAGEAAAVWRERTLPLVWLRERLGLPSAHAPEHLRVLVVEAGGERVGLVVDAFAGRLEAVVRPLTGALAGLPGMAGATSGPRGAVLFVLDLAAVAR